MGMVAILFSGVEPFEQIVSIPSTENSMWNLVKIEVNDFQRRRCLKIFYTRIYPNGKGDNSHNFDSSVKDLLL